MVSSLETGWTDRTNGEDNIIHEVHSQLMFCRGYDIISYYEYETGEGKIWRKEEEEEKNFSTALISLLYIVLWMMKKKINFYTRLNLFLVT